MSNFEPIPCGQTLPINNVHAVSVSMPALQDVIDYEEFEPTVLEKIKSGYPRFILHPYLKLLAQYIQKKYAISDTYEVVVISSKHAVNVISDTFFIHNKIEIDEPFGVILVIKGTCQLQKVLTFIQHVGCNLSSRLAEDYLFEVGLIETKHEEQLDEEEGAESTVLSVIADAYGQPKENVCLAPSGMNAIYSVLKGLKNIQAHNGRNILVQFGWLYLDTMNIVEHYFERNKTFHDINNLDLLEAYLKENGLLVSAIVTEVPTNPTLQCVDLPRLKKLCEQYHIPLVIDSTFATPFNLDLEPYGDIFIESLTKFACGHADVLMGCYILNKNSKLSVMTHEFKKHIDKPYIKDIQRLAYEIKGYEERVKKIGANTKKLVEFFQSCDFIDTLFYCLQEKSKTNYQTLMKHEDAYAGVVSVTFKKEFQKVYDVLNFAKGPSLGTEFTLLMPYVYLAHYDYITSAKGQKFLKEHNLPVDLLRISVGTEDIEDIISEFKKVNNV